MKKIILIFTLIIITSLVSVFADTNGIWHLAKDVRPGTFGSDETPGNYKFISEVFIQNASLEVFSNTSKGIFSFSSVDDGIIGISTHSGSRAIYGWGQNGAYSGYFEGGNFIINSGNVGIGTISPTAKLDIIGNLRFRSNLNCGKLSTDGAGNVLCLPDNVNDADNVIGNEYPLAGVGISVSGGRTVNVNTDVIATKAYVDTKVSTGGNLVCGTYYWDACPAGYVYTGNWDTNWKGGSTRIRCCKIS